nr:MAG TPA: hypothetical protein [Caudoviricetes sp.]
MPVHDTGNGGTLGAKRSLQTGLTVERHYTGGLERTLCAGEG